MQIKSFDWFYNREKGKPCLVAGTAPTIENFPYKKFRGVYVTCGDGAIRLQNLFKADYWVSANSIFPVPEEHLEIINHYKDTVFIFADSVTYSGRPINLNFLHKNLKMKWFNFDQRHFNHSPCPDKIRKCCELLDIYPERDTIQEYIQKKFNRKSHYVGTGTVAVHALAFAILMGCSPIYLQGIELPLEAKDYIHWVNKEADLLMIKLKIDPSGLDLMVLMREVLKTLKDPTSWGRVSRKIAKKTFFPNLKLKTTDNKSGFFDDFKKTLVDFSYLVDLAHDNNIEVYNLSKTSSLNRIKNLPFKDPKHLYFSKL